MVERGLSVAARQVESLGVGGDALCDVGGGLEPTAEHLGGDPPHRARLDVVCEKVGDHAGGSGHRQAGKDDSIGSRDLAAVQADVAAPRLAPSGKRELVHVRPQVADPMQAGSRRVRDDRVLEVVEASPCGPLGCELKPGGPQPEVLGSPAPRMRKTPCATRSSLRSTARRAMVVWPTPASCA